MSTALFKDAIAYAYQHIDEPFSIDDLASSLRVSRDTIEREFREVAGTSPAKMIRRLRGEYAFRTLRDRTQSLLHVALAAGYSDHSAFSRSFRRMFGATPSEARGCRLIQRELEHIELGEPEIVEMRSLALQHVTRSGSYFDAPLNAWAELGASVEAAGVDPETIPMWFGLALDDPHHDDVLPHQVRFRAAVECPVDLGLAEIHVPQRSYARFRYRGRASNLGLAYHYIYGTWREQSEMTLLDEPALLLFDDIPTAGQPDELSICAPLDSRS